MRPSSFSENTIQKTRTSQDVECFESDIVNLTKVHICAGSLQEKFREFTITGTSSSSHSIYGTKWMRILLVVEMLLNN